MNQGVQVGIVVGMPLSGTLSENYGWETVFYLFGGLGAVWFGSWCILIKGKVFVNESIQNELRLNTDIREISCKNDGETGMKLLSIFVFLITLLCI